MRKNIYTMILLFAAVSILGCATMPVFMSRMSVADGIAGKAGFTKEYIKAGDFTLMTYQRFNRRSDSINIYIEGDGRAWETKYRLSDDPTPSNPVALRLAVADPADNIAYIARPGQYPLSGIPECGSKYWSGFRFADITGLKLKLPLLSKPNNAGKASSILAVAVLLKALACMSLLTPKLTGLFELMSVGSSGFSIFISASGANAKDEDPFPGFEMISGVAILRPCMP